MISLRQSREARMADSKAAVEFRTTVDRATDARYVSGRLRPVFKSILQDDPKHDAYIQRMIERDRQANFG